MNTSKACIEEAVCFLNASHIIFCWWKLNPIYRVVWQGRYGEEDKSSNKLFIGSVLRPAVDLFLVFTRFDNFIIHAAY